MGGFEFWLIAVGWIGGLQAVQSGKDSVTL